MGIPHLTSFLQPNAPFVTLSGQDFIIDGPGFAYNVYFDCLSHKSDERSFLDAAPSYQELGSAAIAWLDEIERGGNKITRILFDGYLPPAKLATRFERLSAQTRNLATYYQSHLNVPRSQSKRNIRQFPQLFPTAALRRSGMALPPPAFLVPAVLEVLRESNHYKNITQIVPGEADIYCAEYAKQHGGIVVTGDSDLLLHDLGPEGSVCFYRDMESSSDEASDTIRSRLYCPTDITKQLSLPVSDGLLSLGFELLTDNHCTLQKAVLQASSLRAATKFERQYKDFKERYSSSSAESAFVVSLSQIKRLDDGLLHMRSLDPRVSEYVLQFRRLLGIAKNSSVTELSTPDTIHMFLPILLDCPARTSAWDISTTVRQLAYSLLNLSVPHDQHCFTLLEHRTRQGNASGKLLQTTPVSDILEAQLTLINLLSRVKKENFESSNKLFWVAVAYRLDADLSSSRSKTSLSRTVLEQLAKASKRPETFKGYSWEVVHLHAQVEGVMYSFRILKQITGLVLLYSLGYPPPEEVLGLTRELGSLPELADFPNIQDTIRLIQSVAPVDGDRFDSHTTKTKSPRATSKNQNSRKSAKKRKQTNAVNPFRVLSIN